AVEVKPFLKWAGGKTNLIDRVASFVPTDYKQRRFLEPFLGSGAMFFHLQPQSAILSDLNEDLINCFIAIRDNYDIVNSYLRIHRKRNCKTYYYLVREKYNRSRFSAAQAARFIYLNKACFNGVFRVNKRESL